MRNLRRLDYTEDSQASVDANFFFLRHGIAEVQVSGEGPPLNTKN